MNENSPAINRATVLAALSEHIGAGHAVHAKALVREITDDMDYMELRLRTLRRVIADLRSEGCHICGHPATGYYIAASEAEIDRTCSWLYSRSMTTLQQVAAMKRVSLPDLRGQLRLPE